MSLFILKKKSLKFFFIRFFVLCFLYSFIWLFVSPLYSQKNFTLAGNIGYGYYGRYPFLNHLGTWHYDQKSITLNLSGYIWDPRFLLFNIKGDYSNVKYGQEENKPKLDKLGYELQARFFPQRSISFALRYGKRELSFEQMMLQSNTLRTHQIVKGFDFYLSKIKFLPLIRFNYTDRKFLSTFSPTHNEIEKRIVLNANKTIGKSYFDLSYRYEDRENQFYFFDRTSQHLRVTDRIELGPGTLLWFNGIYSDYSVDLPDKSPIKSMYGLFSSNFIKEFSSKVRGDFKYNFTYTSGGGYISRSHNAGTGFNFHITDQDVITPEFYYFTDSISMPGNEDSITEPRFGLKINSWIELFKIRIASRLGFIYRDRRSQVSGRMKDFSFLSGVVISTGKIEALLLSLSWLYSEIDANISEPSREDYSFFIGVGHKQNFLQYRVELRSKVIRFMELYMYSQYEKYRRTYLFRGITDTQTNNNGITLSLKGLNLSFDYGISRLQSVENDARYDTLLALLDMKIIRGLDFRVQYTRRYREDIFFMGDYEVIFEGFLRYNLGRFSVSAVYRKLEGKFSGIFREDEAIFLRFSRSFGLKF